LKDHWQWRAASLSHYGSWCFTRRITAIRAIFVAPSLDPLVLF